MTRAATLLALLLVGCLPAHAAVPDLCSLDGGRWCVARPTGPWPPPGTGTIPYVCCVMVDGDEFCVSVDFAAECVNGVLGQCEWGYTNADGSVTCYD
jgi:hypothetical protein